MDETIYENILELQKKTPDDRHSANRFIQYIHDVSIKYNTDKIEIILRLFNYLIYVKKTTRDNFLNITEIAEYVIHNINSVNVVIILKYIWANLGTSQPTTKMI